MEGMLKTGCVFSFAKAHEEKKRAERMKRAIYDELSCIRHRLSIIRSSFNFLSDSDLLDSVIFEEKALSIRYSQLIKLAKLQGVSLS